MNQRRKRIISEAIASSLEAVDPVEDYLANLPSIVMKFLKPEVSKIKKLAKAGIGSADKIRSILEKVYKKFWTFVYSDSRKKGVHNDERIEKAILDISVLLMKVASEYGHRSLQKPKGNVEGFVNEKIKVLKNYLPAKIATSKYIPFFNFVKGLFK